MLRTLGRLFSRPSPTEAVPLADLTVASGHLVVRCPCPCRQRMAVTFPDDLNRIAAVLAERPDPATRNWAPLETVEDLERENREHGIPVPSEEGCDARC